MTHSPPQPSLLMKLVALKKGIFALLILSIAVITGFSWRNYELITHWADVYVLNAEYSFVRWILEHLASEDVVTLKRIARVTSVYGTLLAIAATGLWFGKRWAEPLFISLVAVLIPIEIYEVLHHASVSKYIVFIVNLVVLVYLLWHWLRSFQYEQNDTPIP